MTIAKLPLVEEIADVDFTATRINEQLVRDLATGGFLASERNAVLVGGTGTGKTHLAIAIGRACVRSGARVGFFNTVDLVNLMKNSRRIRVTVSTTSIPQTASGEKPEA
jgi:DNA replication protein DnaC